MVAISSFLSMGWVATIKAVVTGWWDSFWKARAKKKELEKLEEQAADRVQRINTEKAFADLKKIVEARREIEMRHRRDTLADTLARMRNRAETNQG